MNRRGERRTRGFTARLLTLLALLVTAVVLIGPKIALAADNPYSTISPATDVAERIQGLYTLIFWGALVVFVGVQIGVIYTSLRFRRRSESDPRPPQTHGNKTLEIMWTIIPAVILLVIFVPTVQALYDNENEATLGRESGYEIDVYGKQWWWEVHYAKPEAVAGVITANEIYVPVDTPLTFNLYSNNVIHSFWVPRLSGKMDVMPGHKNTMGFTVREPGVYFGECAEFCGDSHAYMRFKIVALEEAEFQAYMTGLVAPSSDAANVSGDVTKTPKSFGICLACHRVNGTNAEAASVGLAQSPAESMSAGPNLSNYACRTTIGAGILPNDEESLRAWLADPGSIKQGNHMAAVIKPGSLTPEQIDELVAYLMTLHPEGGCPAIPDAEANNITQLNTNPASGAAPMASPEATPAT